MKINPIIIVDDDDDDADFLEQAFADVCTVCTCRRFASAIPALEYLRNTSETPLAIISDINMPLMNGLEFKQIMDTDMLLSNKAIPFIFLSTSSDSMLVKQACRLCIQGFFQKPDNITDLDIIAKAILDYWTNNKAFIKMAMPANPVEKNTAWK